MAYRIAADASLASTFPHVRRDFYKVKLLRHADGVLRYGDQSVVVKGDVLLFVNPQLPCSWRQVGGRHTGCVCLFTEQFVALRLSTRFLAQLERQFPVGSPRRPLARRTVAEYAQYLGVHPNHLNKALKEATGKTTSEHLAGRLTDEARGLLHHSDWTLAEIGYCLGFEHPANFAAFFKKQTGQPPVAYRRQLRASAVAIA